MVISDCMKEALHVSNTFLIVWIEVRGCRKKCSVNSGLRNGGQAQREMPFISLYIYASDMVYVNVCADVHPCECMCSCFCQDGVLGVGASPGGCLLFMRWAGSWPNEQQQMGICVWCECECV